MEGGRGRKRRRAAPATGEGRIAFTNSDGPLRRTKLEPWLEAAVVYTNYSATWSFRYDAYPHTNEGTEYRCYLIDEYGGAADPAPSPVERYAVAYWRLKFRGPGPCAPRATRSYWDIVSEDDLFWVDGARQADEEPCWLSAPFAPVPYLGAIFLSGSRHPRLSERDCARCRVYAAEERSAGNGRRKPVRYGIRFLSDDSYWVVPADEIVLARTYPT